METLLDIYDNILCKCLMVPVIIDGAVVTAN
jgi:hypothetical protein